MGERTYYKTSNHLKPVFDQRVNFLDERDSTAEITAVNLGKKKATLYENLLQMNTIYECFYKNFTASNMIM